MDFIQIGLLVSIIFLLIIILVFLIKKPKQKMSSSLEEHDLNKIREVISKSITDFHQFLLVSLEMQNKNFASNVEMELTKVHGSMRLLQQSNQTHFIQLLKELTESLGKMNEKNIQNTEINIRKNKESFDEFAKQMKERFEVIQQVVGKHLEEIRTDNNEKLESMKKTVDEKLEKTLETRLKQSFESVIMQIGDVNKAVGEIKGLAVDVGSLKTVLTNVKTKGIVGEVILGNIIREILTTEQYVENYVTKQGSRDAVEFAIKMPGADGEPIYLPIDSKFPLESYHKIKDGIDRGDLEMTISGQKELRSKLKKYAKDISEKYIDVPNTTDFGILFLPIEGLYGEAIESGVFEEVQREYKINIAGPSTLAALLNALQMGFKSLVIQKRSSEVFQLLAAIKTEFMNFAGVLDKTQRKVGEVSDELEKLVGTRTRKIQSKLSQISVLSEQEAKETLELTE